MTLDPLDTQPLYRQVTRQLREQIVSGELAPGDRIGTHRDLAERFEVSIITIRHALSELASDGLIYSRVGRGTFVARTARLQPTVSEHRVLGLVLQDIKSPFFSLIVESIEERAYEAGYSLMLSTVGDQMRKEVRQIEHFRSMGVDGLIIASMQPDHQVTPTIRQIHDSGFPYVMVSYVDDPSFYFVGSDHERGAFLATRHLLDQDRRRIAYVGAEPDNRLSIVRQRGYEEALRQAGLELTSDLIFRSSDEGEWTHFTSGYRIGQQLLLTDAAPDGVFAYNDLLGIGLMQALLDRGVQVPDDIAIVGFDDIARSRFAPIPLTTMRQPTDDIGRQAVNLLLARIRGEHPAPKRSFVPELVVRHSSSLRVPEGPTHPLY